ncbi:hypothetical protein OS493_016854 [Desmophyllum pertusum]|uniref:Uncharacterized protein n=1 Tax=Desmophyllum pertusum TaxID=174260 RepID=A0A9W9YNJ9_9CNID|nr:hypothetical protein OS493_016854 [Desmophyllum pertusum]
MRPTRALYIAWNVADYLHNTHLYTKAIDFYKECFVLLKLTIAHGLERTIANKPRDIERQLYLGLSEAFSEIGCFENSIAMLQRCDKSLSYHEKALAIRKEMKNKALEASSYSNISIVYSTLGQYQKATGYAEKALEIGKEIGDREREGAAWSNISQIYCDIGQYEKAIECQEKELEISKESGDREGEGTSYNTLANITNPSKTLRRDLKSCKKLVTGKEKEEPSLIFQNAYMMLGDYAKSLEYNDKALPIIRSLGFRHDEGSIYLSQAGMYCTLGQYGKSVEYCQKAFEIKTRMGNKKGQASCYQSLGSVYSKLGQYRISIKYSEQSLKICKEIGDLNGEGMACNNLASAYYSLGHYEKSIEYFEKDLRISKEVGNRDGEGKSYCNIGATYFALGQFEKALECQKKALKISKEIGSIDGERAANQKLGLSRAAMRKNLPEAVHHLSESISCHEKMRARLKDEYKLSLDDQNILSYRLLCHLLIDLDKPNDALCTAEQGRARGLVDLLSMKYGIQEVSDARVLHLSAIRDLFTRQRTNFLFLATPMGTISLWFVNMDGKMLFYRFHKRDFHGNDLEDNLKELIENILHSLKVFSVRIVRWQRGMGLRYQLYQGEAMKQLRVITVKTKKRIRNQSAV